MEMEPRVGYLFILDGTVKCAEREMPKARDFKSGYFGRPSASFMIKYAKWIESCKEVVNAKKSDAIKDMIYIRGKFFGRTKSEWYSVESGQKCLKVPEGDKVRVVELIN